MPDTALTRDVFDRRFRERFIDPAFDKLKSEIDRIADAAWDAYSDGRKAPRTRKAGAGYADPDYELSDDWRAAKSAVEAAQRQHDDRQGPLRILMINGSSRSEHTCPGEMSKSWRLLEIARAVLSQADDVEIEVLDLSRLSSEYGLHIHPCKACFSTAAPLCHWPCSCYPNHGQGQVQDWMAEIYTMWVRAHGVMIVAPVHWYQAPSPLKLMMDRMVCADGGNPDPTASGGKDAGRAKALELQGWHYPRHLEGRLFSLIVHGDTEGAETLRRMLADWLTSMHMAPAAPGAVLERYIGYFRPYATSHEDLDADTDVQEEVRIAARTLLEALRRKRDGKLLSTGTMHQERRPK
ncbi:MAG: flavodoxin family protein [Alphaproteobacteria bacterium]|nr:flavodoxin family protein [Alphaproteobacteria bacterium]MCW5739549.1 flavodoxin family protein [Alphaproteobacteria bacterium]